MNWHWFVVATMLTATAMASHLQGYYTSVSERDVMQLAILCDDSTPVVWTSAGLYQFTVHCSAPKTLGLYPIHATAVVTVSVVHLHSNSAVENCVYEFSANCLGAVRHVDVSSVCGLDYRLLRSFNVIGLCEPCLDIGHSISDDDAAFVASIHQIVDFEALQRQWNYRIPIAEIKRLGTRRECIRFNYIFTIET